MGMRRGKVHSTFIVAAAFALCAANVSFGIAGPVGILGAAIPVTSTISTLVPRGAAGGGSTASAGTGPCANAGCCINTGGGPLGRCWYAVTMAGTVGIGDGVVLADGTFGGGGACGLGVAGTVALISGADPNANPAGGALCGGGTGMALYGIPIKGPDWMTIPGGALNGGCVAR